MLPEPALIRNQIDKAEEQFAFLIEDVAQLIDISLKVLDYEEMLTPCYPSSQQLQLIYHLRLLLNQSRTIIDTKTDLVYERLHKSQELLHRLKSGESSCPYQTAVRKT